MNGFFEYLNLVAPFVFNFNDPATIYCHLLIIFHTDVMGYLFLILVLVNWSLFSILRLYLWRKLVFHTYALFKSSYYNILNSIFTYRYLPIVLDEIFGNIFVPFDEVDSMVVSYIDGEWEDFYSPPTRNLSNFGDFYLKTLITDEILFIDKIFGTNFIKTFNQGEEYSADYYDWVNSSFKEDFFKFPFFFTNATTYPEDEALVTSFFFKGDKESNMFEVNYFLHSSKAEFTWATFPTIIIALILFPSVLLLYSLDEEFNPSDTIKVIGHQWFWSYEQSFLESELQHVYKGSVIDYSVNPFKGFAAPIPSNLYFIWDNLIPFPDNHSYLNLRLAFFNKKNFDSVMVPFAELELGSKRLLDVDLAITVPVHYPIKYIITSSDVLHSWAIPSMGVKVDAVPGRLSQSILILRGPGTYYGQCSELCGVAHGFMPIVIIGYQDHFTL